LRSLFFLLRTIKLLWGYCGDTEVLKTKKASHK
jgi:hypothetical protein